MSHLQAENAAWILQVAFGFVAVIRAGREANMVTIAVTFLLPLEQTLLCLYQENKQFYLLFLFFMPTAR